VVDCPTQALLTVAAAVLDDATLRGLADCLGQADAEPASIRYRRLMDALSRLPSAGRSGEPVAQFLATDAVVLARMSAAVEVMHAAGFEVDTAGGIAEHLRRAVRWQRHGDGPVPALHRSCAADIARGSLRLWAQAGGTPQPLSEPMGIAAVRNRQARGVLVRGQAQLARVQLGAQARTVCAALRTDLSREAAQLSRRGLVEFEGRVHAELLRVATEFDDAIGNRLADLAQAGGMTAAAFADQSGPDIAACLPSRRWPRLENRLTALLGVGFGFSVSLTAGRVIADLRPDWSTAAAFGCAGFGLVLTAWVVGARRLLTERAAAERAVGEAVANLRVALQERVLTRALAVESALAAEFADPVSDRPPRRLGHTPD
jgi:hypothetical protein